MDHAPDASNRQDVLMALLVEARDLLPRDPASAQAILQAALAMIAGGARGPVLARTPAARLRDLVSFIDAHVAEPLSLERLAAHVGVSRSQLTRLFRARYGVSLQTYIRGRRVTLAQARLREADAPLAQLALDCGFSDQSHLSRAFRDAVGVSPGRWRLEAALTGSGA